MKSTSYYMYTTSKDIVDVIGKLRNIPDNASILRFVCLFQFSLTIKYI